MRKTICVISLIINFTCFAETKITYQYYPIIGRTYDGLLSELNSKGPNGYHAYAHWYVKWRYKYDKGFSGCGLKKITVTNTATITFPEWKNRSGASKGLVDEWLRYKEALMQHELGHVDFGTQAKKDIEKALQNLSPAPTCNAMETTANKIAYEILQKYQKKDGIYDMATDHGHSQGAYFNKPF